MLHSIRTQFAIQFIVAFVAAASLCAQEPASSPKPAIGVYKLDYVFSEVQDGKRINSRTYSLLVQGRDRGSIRMGNRVPVITAENSKDVSSGTVSFQYLDIGVSIDCRVADELESGIALSTVVDVSSVVPEQPVENRTAAPVVRQTKFQMDTTVPLGKQTLLSSADEIDSARRFEVQVTATKVR